MAHAFTPGLQLVESGLVTRVRELPIAGELLVKVGDRVSAESVVARALLPGELHILRLAEKLGLEPQQALSGLKVCAGSEVRAGDLLCEHLGLFGLLRSRFVAPLAGTLEYINQESGHLGIRVPPRGIELRAYISGEVSAIAPGKSVSVTTQAAFAQGIFGVGGERIGILRKLEIPAERVVEAQHIPADAQGAILFGGTRPSAEALRRAAELGAVGLIVGALDDRGLSGYLGYDLGIALTGDEDVSMSVIATEGFGGMPISAALLGLLEKFSGKQAVLNGATQVRAGAVRPEIIIPLALGAKEDAAAQKENTRAAAGLQVGSRIRLIRVPYFGAWGIVTALPPAPVKIETGSEARVLEARLDSGQMVTVPRANVELCS